MTEKLPVLMTIPHGGQEIPSELAGRTRLSAKDIFMDSDALTQQIYDLREFVQAVVVAPIARAFVDLNRAPDDRPPENPDGVVKTRTVAGKLIYTDDCPLTEAEIALLLKKYHDPFHARLNRIAKAKAIEIAVDCHSMLARAPENSPMPGAPRPLFCVSNRGGPDGNPNKNYPHITCAPHLVRKMAACLQSAFEVKAADVKINDPFHGGYITASHGLKTTAWIQVELNRKLYLEPPWFDPAALAVDPLRIAWLKNRFHEALKCFCKKM